MYKGYIETTATEEQWGELYSNPTENSYDCLENQYLILNNNNGDSDYFKWSNGSYKKLSYKVINNSFVSKIKPRNPQQMCAFDMLQDYYRAFR